MTAPARVGRNLAAIQSIITRGNGQLAQQMQRLLSAAARREVSVIRQMIPEFSALQRDHNSPFHKHTMENHTFEFISYLLADQNISGELTAPTILAALLHDIGKPATETITPEGQSQYFRHDSRGAEIAGPILERLGIAQDREAILALIEHHMAPVQLISNMADDNLTDKALGRFMRNVVEPLGRAGVSLDMIFAFGRADILASQGPKGYEMLGIRLEDGESALAERVNELIGQIRTRLSDMEKAAQAAQASKPQSINGGDLIRAGFQKGPNMGTLLVEAAQLEREQELTGEELVNHLRAQHPDWLNK